MENLLKKYNSLLVGRNAVMNLTAHKTEDESYLYNIQDSLLFADAFKDFKGKLLDIGSGGGCPAIPLKIVFPQIEVTMVDSVAKKVNFLNEAVSELGLGGITAIHTRVEDYAAKNREKFEMVTAKAVAELPTLLEYTLPFLKVGGLLVAYKGSNARMEIMASMFALREMGGKVIDVQEATLHVDNGRPIIRTLVIIKKIKKTPAKYPRGKNLPRTKPFLSRIIEKRTK